MSRGDSVFTERPGASPGREKVLREEITAKTWRVCGSGTE